MRVPIALKFLLVLLISVSCFYNSPKAQIHLHTDNGRAYVFSKKNTFLPSAYDGYMLIRPPHTFTVLLNDGSTFSVSTRLQVNNGRTYLRFKEAKQYKRIFPKDTKQIYIEKARGEKLIGRPAFGDSCWLFQVSRGKLNTYSIYPQKGTIYISAVTKDPQTAPIRINQANIIQLVQDNPKALQFADKMQLMKAIYTYNAED